MGADPVRDAIEAAVAETLNVVRARIMAVRQEASGETVAGGQRRPRPYADGFRDGRNSALLAVTDILVQQVVRRIIDGPPTWFVTRPGTGARLATFDNPDLLREWLDRMGGYDLTVWHRLGERDVEIDRTTLEPLAGQ